MKALFVEPYEFARQILSCADEEAPGQIDPHLSRLWFHLLAETAMPAGTKLALASVGEGSFLPLMTRIDQPGRLLALSNFYTPLFGLINELHADSATLNSVVVALGKRRAKFHEARLAPMDVTSHSYKLICEAFAKAGWQVDDYFCFGNWYYPVEGRNYHSYLAERPSRLRNTIERASRKLAQTNDFTIEIVRGSESLESAIADFVTVYNQSWKNPEPFVEFIPGLCRLAARMGWLRLGVARLQGQPIAAQIWLVAAGKAQIVKLAYDAKFAKTSAGTVLTATLIKHVIEIDKVNEIDYLMGDDPYKQDWMSQRRERRGLIAFNPCFPRGVSAMLWHKGGKFWRRIQFSLKAKKS